MEYWLAIGWVLANGNVNDRVKVTEMRIVSLKTVSEGIYSIAEGTAGDVLVIQSIRNYRQCSMSVMKSTKYSTVANVQIICF